MKWDKGSVPYPCGTAADGYVRGPWGIRPYGKPRRWALIHQASHLLAGDSRTLIGAKKIATQLETVKELDWTSQDPFRAAPDSVIRQARWLSRQGEGV